MRCVIQVKLPGELRTVKAQEAAYKQHSFYWPFGKLAAIMRPRRRKA